MTGQSWWWDIIRRLFASLDGMIYGFVQTLYQLFAYIAKLSIFGTEEFTSFRERIYLVLGIIMLFKIAFSLISLLSNPDDITDSKKGFSGIIQRVIISLILITFIPTIFTVTREIQNIVIEDNIIGQFFLGNLDDPVDPEEMQRSGDMIAFQVLSAFYYPDPNLQLKPGKDCADNNKNVVMPDVDSDSGMFSTSRKITIREKDLESCGADGKKTLTGPEGFYYVTHHLYDVDLYLSEYVNEQAGEEGNGDGSDYYAMHYSWLISTIAGVVVAWMFLGYCVDAAIRAVKLGALELIAPIPIFSYIDPKKGQEIFNNWVKTTISTYLSLFGRLLLIYFVLYVCNIISKTGFSVAAADGTLHPLNDNSMMSNIARAFVYIGLLLFAKDAPELFSNMFGIKMEKSYGTKLAKKGIVGTGLAASLMGTKLLGEGYKKARSISERGKFDWEHRDKKLTREEEEQRKKIIESGRFHGLRALTSGATTGFMGGFKSGKFGYVSGMKAANTKHKLREDGITLTKEWGERTSSFFGVSGKYGDFGQFKEELKDLNNKRRNAQALENRFNEQRVNEFANMIKTYDGLDDNFTSQYEAALEEGNVDKIDEVTKGMIDRYKATLAQQGMARDEILQKRQELEKTVTNINKLNAEYHRQDQRGQKLEKEISDTKKKIDSINGGSK